MLRHIPRGKRSVADHSEDTRKPDRVIWPNTSKVDDYDDNYYNLPSEAILSY